MPDSKKYDTSEPILILVRRGRKGRGFSISPVEDVSNAAVCADVAEVGEVISEMLNDEEQPRVNINDLIAAASAPQRSDDDDEYEDDEDGEGRSGGLFDGVADAEDPADAILFNIFQTVVEKGRAMSTKRVQPRGRRKRSRS